MSEDEDLAAIRQLAEAEQAGERHKIPIGPFSAFSLIGMLQLVTRHPDLGEGQLAIAESMIRDLAKGFEHNPAIMDLIRRGNDPAHDVPRETVN
jgi:hypothetical protein